MDLVYVKLRVPVNAERTEWLDDGVITRGFYNELQELNPQLDVCSPRAWLACEKNVTNAPHVVRHFLHKGPPRVLLPFFDKWRESQWQSYFVEYCFELSDDYELSDDELDAFFEFVTTEALEQIRAQQPLSYERVRALFAQCRFRFFGS